MKNLITRQIIVYVLSFLILINWNTYSLKAEVKEALLIGNANYEIDSLTNPINDVNSLKDSLENIGFNVIVEKNVNLKSMVDATREFGKKIRKADVALFFFSGHGVQFSERNWLIPIEADIVSESDIEFEAFNIERLYAEFKDGFKKRVNIAIFDACRSNNSLNEFSNISNGLGQPKIKTTNSFIAYSTAPGSVAYDGEGDNSPYVEELVKWIDKPGIAIESIFRQVRIAVEKNTQKNAITQIPWEHSSLNSEFIFKKNTSIQSQKNEKRNRDPDEEMWRMIQDSNLLEEYVLFEKSYPLSRYLPLVRLNIKRLRNIQENNKKEVYPYFNNESQLYLNKNQEYSRFYSVGSPKYIGQAIYGKPEGYGKLIYNNRDYYEGTFSQGVIIGFGKFYKRNKTIIGIFENGELNGIGKHIIKDDEFLGDQIISNFDQGTAEGLGLYLWNDGEMLLGYFESGDINEGVRFYKNGNYKFTDVNDNFSKSKFDSNLLFYSDNKNWFGNGVYNKHSIYFGDVEDGLPNGEGILKQINGSIYIGNFENGFKSGYGQLYVSDSNIFTGFFEKDEYSGAGTDYFISYKENGIYQNSKLSSYHSYIDNDSKRITGEKSIEGELEGFTYFEELKYGEILLSEWKNGKPYNGVEFKDGYINNYIVGGVWKNKNEWIDNSSFGLLFLIDKDPNNIFWSRRGLINEHLTYFGNIKNGYPDGKGIDYYKGDVFIGEFKKGSYHKFGTSFYSGLDNEGKYHNEFLLSEMYEDNESGDGVYFGKDYMFLGSYKESNRIDGIYLNLDGSLFAEQIKGKFTLTD